VNFFKVTIWGNITALATAAAAYERSFFSGTAQGGHHSLFAMIFAFGLLCVFVVLRKRTIVQRALALRMLTGLDPAVRARLSRDLAFFNSLISILGRAGIRRTPAQTPREMVDRLQPAASHRDAAWLVDQFYALRFGTVRMTTALRREVEESLIRLRDKISGRLP
jgi:hypothetical protein